MKFVGDERKKRPKRFGAVRQFLRGWLGINGMDIRLHNTRKILFDLQRTVEDRDIRTLRSRVRISTLRRRDEQD